MCVYVFIKILQDALLIYFYHTCCVVVIDLFVGICYTSGMVGKFNRLRWIFMPMTLLSFLDLFMTFQGMAQVLSLRHFEYISYLYCVV